MYPEKKPFFFKAKQKTCKRFSFKESWLKQNDMFHIGMEVSNQTNKLIILFSKTLKRIVVCGLKVFKNIENFKKLLRLSKSKS